MSTVLRATCKRNKLNLWIVHGKWWNLTVDPPRINRGNCLFTWKWRLTVDPLFANHGSAPSPGSTEVITFSCESESWLLILSLSITHLPPGSTEVITFSCKVKVDCWSSLCWLWIHPPPRDLCTPGHSVPSTGWPLVGLTFQKHLKPTWYNTSDLHL